MIVSVVAMETGLDGVLVDLGVEGAHFLFLFPVQISLRKELNFERVKCTWKMFLEQM